MIRERIESHFGSAMRPHFVWVDRIPRTGAGKFRFQLDKIGKRETSRDHAAV